MVKIQIFEKATGSVVDTVEAYDLKSFQVYWESQGNHDEYDWRLVSGGSED